MSTKKPLPAQMLDLITGYWVSKMVHVAAELNLADLLREGPRTPAELAGSTGTDPSRLHRLLRGLASVGVFAEHDDGRFDLTPLAETLRTDRPDSMHSFARMMPSSCNWRGWDDLMSGIRTPTTPFETALGSGHFDYLAKHPEEEAVFGQAMASISGAENPAVAAALDLAGVSTLVDLGGSGGHLLAAVLRQHPNVRGVLFDQPQVVEAAKRAPFLRAPALAERVSFAGGDFFASAPEADAYLMKYILHDWDDDQCVRILSNCRKAMAKGGQVLVVDTVIEPGNAPSWGKLLDLNMLVLTGGRERTEAEFATLFDAAGLQLQRIVPTACPLCIVVGAAK